MKTLLFTLPLSIFSVLVFGMQSNGLGVQTNMQTKNQNKPIQLAENTNKIDQKKMTPEKNSTDLQDTYENIEIVYQETTKIPDDFYKDIPPEVKGQIQSMAEKPILMLLKHNGFSSIYSELNNQTDSISIDGDTDSKTIFSFSSPVLYKNYDEDLMIMQTQILDTKYLVNNKITQIHWTITDETKKIGKFNCKKATATVNNENVVAYYTDEIPVSVGPLIYGRLPGVIISLETPGISYLATKISLEHNLQIDPPTDGKKISEQEYLKLVDEINSNPDVKIETMEEYDGDLN